MSATNRGGQRAANDFYPTPGWLTRAVLPILWERLTAIGVNAPRIFEPACGDGAIVNELEALWPTARIDASDIVSPYNVDFLTDTPRPIYDLIITNPPYSLALEFCERAKLWRRTENSLIAMLLRINFLGSRKRAAWMRENIPSIAVSPRRPSFGTNKNGKPGTDATEYAWFIWPAGDPHVAILHTEGTDHG